MTLKIFLMDIFEHFGAILAAFRSNLDLYCSQSQKRSFIFLILTSKVLFLKKKIPFLRRKWILGQKIKKMARSRTKKVFQVYFVEFWEP